MSEGGMEVFGGKVVARFPRKGCIAVKGLDGVLRPGTDLNFSKCVISGSEEDFDLRASVASIEVDHRPVNAFRVIRNDDGSKAAEVVFEGESAPVVRKDRRCGIRLTRGPLPPNNASVTLVA